MSRRFFFLIKILLLALPQLGLSAVAIMIFTREFKLPDSQVWLHLATLLPLQCAFFWVWALISRKKNNSERRWFRVGYTTALFFKAAGINLLYLASYFSNQLWGAYVSWGNLSALLPHLRGFYLALGPSSIGALAVGFVAAGVYFFTLWKLVPRFVRWLQWTFAAPTTFWSVAGVIAILTLVSATQWFLNIDPDRMLRQDPVLAFWTNRTAAKPLLTPDMLADLAAERAYRVPVSFRKRNVIIISIDCMRADHLSFRGYPRDTTPFLTGLAAAGRFQQVDFSLSNGNDSPQGILAMLGARYPHRHNIYNFKLPDVLKQAGYRTHVFGTGDHTTLGDMRRFYGPNIDVFSDGLSPRSYSVNDDRGLLESLQKIPTADGTPAFFFFHLMSPHSLAVKEEAFARWQPALLKLEWEEMIFGGIRPEVMINTYDNGLYQADHYTKEIFEVLKTKGYLRDYVGVITGDHGEGLGERGNFGHTKHLFMEDIKVPIIFFESEPVDYGTMPWGSLVDIAPTLTERLGLPPPEIWDGQSLFRKSGPDRTFVVGKRQGQWRGALLRKNGETYKYLFFGKGQSDFRELLFNLTVDPDESNNLATADPSSLLTEMRRLARDQFNSPIPPIN